MNYQKIHDQIIKRSLLEDRIKGRGTYYEEHHIVPRCLGGLDNKENLVLLTAREHFLVHLLLIRIYPENYKLIYAFTLMSKFSGTLERKYILSTRLYEESRLLFSKLNSKTHKGKVLSEETKQKLRDFNLGKKSSEETIKKITFSSNNRSQETKDKISKSLTGRKLSEDHVKKITESNTGKKRTEEFKKSQSKLMSDKITSGVFKPNISGFKTHIKGEFKHSDETKKKMSDLKSGKTHEEIFGKLESDRRREKLKLNTGSKNPNYKEVDILLLKNMLDEGIPIYKIMEKLKVGYAVLADRFFKSYNLTFKQYLKKN